MSVFIELKQKYNNNTTFMQFYCTVNDQLCKMFLECLLEDFDSANCCNENYENRLVFRCNSGMNVSYVINELLSFND